MFSQQIRNEQSRSIPFECWVRRHDDFLYLIFPHTSHKCVNRQILRADSIQWRKSSLQNVVNAFVGSGRLHGNHISSLFDNADHLFVSLRRGTNAAKLSLSEVEAPPAGTNRIFHIANRLGQGECLDFRATQNVVSQPFGRLTTDAWQSRKLLDKPRDGRAKGMCVFDLLCHHGSVSTFPAE
jgi:hypothetical protein